MEERIARLTEVDDNGCWLWLGHLDRRGYGRLEVNGTYMNAHRGVYTVFVGPIPDGLHLDHLCRNTTCVNPMHMEPVTNAENQRRALIARREMERAR